MYDWIILFKTSEIYSAIILITVIFLVLSSGFVVFMISYKVRQGKHHQEKKHMEEEFSKQLMQSQIEVQEATMTELGKELHDNICQQITYTKLILFRAIKVTEEAPARLIEAEKALGETISAIRSLTKSLDKEWLEQFNLISNLEAEISRIRATKTVRVFFHHAGKLPLEAAKQLMLFRIVQEALQNAIRHAGANDIRLRMEAGDEWITFAIKDNGRGFDTAGNMAGVGIRNMKHRTNLLGGKIQWQSSASGSTVSIDIPINDQDHEN